MGEDFNPYYAAFFNHGAPTMARTKATERTRRSSAAIFRPSRRFVDPYPSDNYASDGSPTTPATIQQFRLYDQRRAGQPSAPIGPFTALSRLPFRGQGLYRRRVPWRPKTALFRDGHRGGALVRRTWPRYWPRGAFRAFADREGTRSKDEDSL